MKKSIIIISSFLMLMLAAGSVFAWGHGRGQGMGNDSSQDCRRYGGQSAWNDLSQDQRDQLGALRQAFIDETYEIRSAKFQKQQEMRMLMETSSPDRAALARLSGEITDLQKQVRDKRIDYRLAVKKISPELGMGAGSGQGRGKGKRFGKGGHGGCRGQGNNWNQNN